MTDYVITGNGATATGTDNSGVNAPVSGPINTVVATVLGWATAGQTIEFNGVFNPNPQLEVRKGSLTLQSINAILDGLGTSPFGLFDFSLANIIDGFEIRGFTSHGIIPAGGSEQTTIRNCYIHDNPGATGIMPNGLGKYLIQNCRIAVNWTGIMGNNGPNNIVDNCDIYGWSIPGGHGIYFDGFDAANKGFNEIKNCKFHDGTNGGALIIKCQANKIHHNEFYSMPTNTSVAISLFSELAGYLANDNEIYNNNFHDSFCGLFLGHDTAGNDPTLRNKIHDNTFTNLTQGIRLIASSGVLGDTQIYYNTFTNCINPFPTITWGDKSLVQNTVIAYNTFTPAVPAADEAWLRSLPGIIIYGNTGLADYNPSGQTPIPPPPIPPPPPPEGKNWAEMTNWRVNETWNAPTYIDQSINRVPYGGTSYYSIRMEKGDGTKSREVLLADFTDPLWAIRVKPGDHIIFKAWMMTQPSATGEQEHILQGVRLGIDFSNPNGGSVGTTGNPMYTNDHTGTDAQADAVYVHWGKGWTQRTMEFDIPATFPNTQDSNLASGTPFTPAIMTPWIQVWDSWHDPTQADAAIAWFTDTELYINGEPIPTIKTYICPFDNLEFQTTQAAIDHLNQVHYPNVQPPGQWIITFRPWPVP